MIALLGMQMPPWQALLLFGAWMFVCFAAGLITGRPRHQRRRLHVWVDRNAMTRMTHVGDVFGQMDDLERQE